MVPASGLQAVNVKARRIDPGTVVNAYSTQS